ncbi:hypothetical protein LUZ63_012149 [Rhynchospora breviuscula]|uniref:Pectin acetylesterase n=1 Tax=Rhynchospora breviuscula TaxID=2022672 RepID=A0A9Q0CK44_9POAL|nr:hypothetical protein LUZ63_012149 [Rhynchospora breviuscula]
MVLKFTSWSRDGALNNNSSDPILVDLTLVKNATEIGAVCLDGSPPGYHFLKGYDSGTDNWLIYLEGGGWCHDVASCNARKYTNLGSSNRMERQVPFTGILSNLPSNNPDFFNWNIVVIRYCDGASFSGDVEETNQDVEKRFPNCISQMDATKCFFPEEIIKGLSTPVFVLNSAYDSEQIQTMLVPSSSDPSNSWANCKLDIKKCNSNQMKVLQGFRATLLDNINDVKQKKDWGIFINSCFVHCQSWRNILWHGPNYQRINNKTTAESVGDWYFDRREVKEIDCPYPCNPTCVNDGS